MNTRRAGVALIVSISLGCGADDDPRNNIGADAGPVGIDQPVVTDTGPADAGACPTGGCPAVTELAAGERYTLALLRDGTVRAWGDNSEGQLGDGSTMVRARPVVVPGLAGVAQVAAGAYSSCARLTDGTVRCWGAGTNGQLGDGQRAARPTPGPVSGVAGAIDVAVGLYHACAVVTDGTVRCWGRGGDVGDGTVSTRDTPVTLAGLAGVTRVVIGRSNLAGETGSFNCALRGDGTVSCWGTNGAGQLGNGTRDGARTPADVPGLTHVADLALGGQHGCAVLRDNTVRCWGANARGELGDGTREMRVTPVAVPGLTGVRKVVCGDGHSCALLTDGTVRCWGANGAGELGQGTRGSDPVTSPVAVPGLAGVADLAAGSEHTCAVLGDGATRCWGNNFTSQLGDGTEETRAAPTSVAW